MNKPQRLVWLCPEFTPYHDIFFDALATDGAFDLRVLIMMGPTHTHPFATRTKRPYTWHQADPRVRIDRRLIQSILDEQEAWYVVSSYYRPTLMAAMQALADNHRPFLYWTDTPLPQETLWTDTGPKKRSWLRRMARQHRLNWIFSHAHRTLATGAFGVAAVEKLGCPASKSVVFPYWVALGNPPPPRTRPPEAHPVCQLLSVGQLIYRKGWDIAIRALAKALRPDTPDSQPVPLITWQLIGD